MKKLNTLQLLAVSSVAVAGFLMTSGLALAQSVVDPVGEVVVQAPFELDRSEAQTTPGSAVKTEIIELKRQVDIADLDLSNPEDVTRLEARIRMVAEDSCERLAEMFPLDDSNITSIRRCTRQAVASAMGQTEAVIAAALN